MRQFEKFKRTGESQECGKKRSINQGNDYCGYNNKTESIQWLEQSKPQESQLPRRSLENN